MVRLIPLGVVVWGVTVHAEPVPPARDVMKEIHRIEGLVRRGEADSARLELVARARARPGDAMPRVYVAWLTLPSDESWNELKAVATIFPENPWPHLGMGRTYLAWKMKDQARTALAQAMKADARFFPGLVLEGDLHAAAADWKAAEAAYRKALALHDDPEARGGLGVALAEQGKTGEAHTELVRAIADFPEQPAALKALVPILRTTGKPGELLAALSALVAVSPKDRLARRQLAELKMEAGDEQGAAADLEKLLKLGDPELVVVERAAQLYRQLGREEDEERTLVTLASLKPTSALPSLRLAELKLARGDLAGGEERLLEALQREPGSVPARLRLARVKEDQGVLYQALDNLRAIPPADRSPEVQEAITRMETECRIPKMPPRGRVVVVYSQVASTLDRLWAERRVAKPTLAGALKLRLDIAEGGAVKGVEVLQDTLNDPLLLAHVYFSLKDAVYTEPRAVQPVIDFVVGTPAPAARKSK